MNTLLLSTLLFHSLGTVAIVLAMALTACLPDRRPLRRNVVAVIQSSDFATLNPR